MAVLHSPEALNWTPLTEAKVNIRATLRSARFHGLITEHDEDQLIRVLKLIHYKELTISSFEQRVRSIFREFDPLFSWIRDNGVTRRAKTRSRSWTGLGKMLHP